MSSAELKSVLHKLIVETDDISILAKIKEVFFALKEDKIDWADLLSDKEKQMIDTGLKQANDGELISHKEIRNSINKWINEKQK